MEVTVSTVVDIAGDKCRVGKEWWIPSLGRLLMANYWPSRYVGINHSNLPTT